MVPMELKQLLHFVTLAETLNYRLAAERLHMTQPPLSASISKLESETGVKLFERNRSGTRLSAAGMSVLDDARRTLAHAEQFKRHAIDVSSGSAGVLSIGYVASASFQLLPTIIPAFRQAYPRVQLKLIESTSIQLLPMVEQGELDVALIRTPFPRPTDLSYVKIHRDLLIAALPERAEWKKDDAIELRALADEPFILQRADVGNIQSLVILACQQAGFVPRVSQEASLLQTVIGLVQSGLGVALVPEVNRSRPVPGVIFKNLKGKGSGIDIGNALVWRRDGHTPSVKNFTDITVECLSSVSDSNHERGV